MNGEGFPIGEYESLWLALAQRYPGDAYLAYHKQRYYELFHALARSLGRQGMPAILEVGISPFAVLYRQVVPASILVTIDRPVEMGGMRPEQAIAEWGSMRHYNADLNHVALSPLWGSPALGIFDYVVFTEVLEHLLVHPAQIIGELLGLLAPGGRLYLSTPNAMAHGKLRQLLAGEMPLRPPPWRAADRDAGHHFREYTMRELQTAVAEAGGVIETAEFSDCWDPPDLRPWLDQRPHLRTNLVTIARNRMPEDDADANQRPAPRDLSIDLDTARELSPRIAADLVNLQENWGHDTERVHARIAAYERGRFISFMRWLHRLTHR